MWSFILCLVPYAESLPIQIYVCCAFLLLNLTPWVSEGALKTCQDAQLEAYCHAAEVGDKHPEDHNVHEDGVGGQVRQG